jgi:hypothetical protein
VCAASDGTARALPHDRRILKGASDGPGLADTRAWPGHGMRSKSCGVLRALGH